MTLPEIPLPKGFKVPENYRLNSEGVFHYLWKRTTKEAAEKAKAIGLEVTQENGTWHIKSEALIAPAPVAPIRVFRDFDGNEDVEIAWWHGGQVVRRFFPREVVKDGRALVKRAGPAGFPAITFTATDIERWLFDAETVNELPVEMVARQLGWQPDRAFVSGNGTLYRVRPPYEGMDRIILAHRPAGELSDWLSIIEAIEGLPLVQMALYASYAAPLLALLELQSFIFHFAGLSSRGKTTSAQVGMSVWANPRIDGGAMGEWKGTRVAIERRLSLVNGLPVVLDETANVSHPNVIRDMIYTIPQGQEKARGSIDGMRTTLPWSAVVISTGEASLLAGVREGGAAARVLEVEGTPFGLDGGMVAEEVRASVEHCYGVAGVAYVEHLRGLDREELRACHRKLTERFKSKAKGNIARRRAPYVAVMKLAAQIARAAGVLPFEPPADEVWDSLFTDADSHDDRPGEALDVIRNWIASNPHRIYDPHRRKDDGESVEPVQNIHNPPPLGWAGKVVRGERVALNPEEVSRILATAGYDIAAVKSAWAERGAIVRQRKDLNAKVRMGDKTVRWMVFEPVPTGGSD